MGAFPPPSFWFGVGWDSGSTLRFGQVTVAIVLRGALLKRAAAKKQEVYFARWVGRSGIICSFGRGSKGGLGLFLLPGGLPLGLGAGCACFIGFLIGHIFLNDLRGIRRDPKTANDNDEPLSRPSRGSGLGLSRGSYPRF